MLNRVVLLPIPFGSLLEGGAGVLDGGVDHRHLGVAPARAHAPILLGQPLALPRLACTEAALPH